MEKREGEKHALDREKERRGWGGGDGKECGPIRLEQMQEDFFFFFFFNT